MGVLGVTRSLTHLAGFPRSPLAQENHEENHEEATEAQDEDQENLEEATKRLGRPSKFEVAELQ